MNNRKYLLKKFMQAMITIFIVLIFNYFLFRVMPGDPIRVLIRNPRISVDALAEIRAQFGLDLPWYTQFIYYLKDLLHGNLGSSFYYREPVLNIIMERVPATLILVGTGTIISIFLGIIIGVVVAWKRGTKIDIIGLGICLILYSTPAFWFGILMVMFFAVYLRVFPTGLMSLPGVAYSSLLDQFMTSLRHLFLPVLTFTLIYIGGYAIIMRNSVIEVLNEDYIITARAKGISYIQLLKRHAVPNALLPLVSMVAINLGFVIAGAIQVETVFSWPGLGRLMYTALLNRDYPLLQGLFLFLTTCVVGANFCADILYSYLDPRVKLS